MIQERRGMMKAWNLILIIISFLLTIVGTFMTRSGVVQSVHAFGSDPVLAWTFGGFMLVIVLVSFGLLIWRLPLLRSRGELESVMSREFAFLVNNWLFLSLRDLRADRDDVADLHRVAHDPRRALPVVLAWQDPGRARRHRPAVLQPVHAAARARAAAADRHRPAARVAQDLDREPGPPVRRPAAVRIDLHGRAAAVRHLLAVGPRLLRPVRLHLWTIVQEFYRGVALRRKQRPQGVVEALISLVLRARRRYGGYIVHLGVVLMFLGWAGNAYKLEKKVQMRPGEEYTLGAYTIRHEGLRATEDWQKEMITADLSVLRDGAVKDVLRPARWWYYQLPDQPTTEVSRYMTPGEDVYVSMQEVDMTSGWTQLSLYINPLVNWIWIGMAVMLAGSLVCAGTRKSEGAVDDA
jgi:cytochrome c-type biogenesis protein CcmF